MAEGGYEFDDFTKETADVNDVYDDEYEEPSLMDDRYLEDTSRIDQEKLDELSHREPNELQSDLRDTKVDSFFNAFEEKYGEKSQFRDYEKFTYKDGALYLDDKILTNKNDPTKFLELSTLAQKYGVTFVRQDLGFPDYNKSMSSKARKALQSGSEQINEIHPQNIEMTELPQAAEQVVQEINEVLNQNEMQTQTEGLTFRELAGLDQALQRTRGELVNNLGKLTQLDEDILMENQNLAQAERRGNEEQQNEIRQRIKNLEIERDARLEVASQNSTVLRTQINRIKETFNKILEDDTTLAEKVRTIFREQGITVVSILAALSLAISTIIASIVAATRGVVVPPPAPAPAPAPSPAPGKNVKEWMKDTLKHLSNLLQKLGSKALDALPGIIGAAVSWLMNVLSGSVGWLAEHVYAFVSGIAILVVMYIQRGVSS